MQKHARWWKSLSTFGFGSLVISTGVYTLPAIAQLTPDASLGEEGSRITPDVLINGDFADLIEGGAIRESNLFHSFLDFNVDAGQQVYFANPISIENIITRVTGLTESQIRGTLGVDGAANLYLINPNGIVFGPDAQLDIRGSFIGSTAGSLSFADGYSFDTVNPDAPPLLLVSTPTGLTNWLPTQGNITSQATLSAGQDLALTSSGLDIQGQLQAGGDLSLIATESLLAQDTPLQALVLLAEGDLFLQGNQSLELLALANPGSGLFAGENLLLRSEQAVIGDAYYVTGGNFEVQQVDGRPGALSSPNDPVIRASGDVAFDSYTGASLHILAGGGVTVDEIEITGPDTVGNTLQESITLSDGTTTISIDGHARPTLDIRAGTLAFSTAGITGDPSGFAPTVPELNAEGTRANIAIVRIRNPGGQVFLSNQYVPDPALSGNITVGETLTADFDGGGDVIIDSRGELTATFVNASGGDVFGFLETFDPSLFNGNGGDLIFLASGDLTLPEASEVYTYGLENGAVRFASETSIRQGEFSFIEGSTVGVGTGGDFSFQAPLIVIDGSVAIFLDGTGTGGDLILNADQFEAGTGSSTAIPNLATVVFGDGPSGQVLVDANQITLDSTFLGSQNQSFFEGPGGDVLIRARSLTAIDGSQVGSLTGGFAFGDAGNVNVIAEKSIVLQGLLPGGGAFDFAVPSGIFSSINADAEGNGGTVTISTGMLVIEDGAQVRASSLGIGNGGAITVEATDAIILDGAVYDAFEDTTFPSQIVSEVSLGGEGEGGDVTLTTGRLTATNGGVISVSTDSFGDAGDIRITATESVTFDGATTFDIPSLSEETAVRESGLRSEALALATGSGGNITVTTPNLSVTNRGTLEASTLGTGTAGNFKFNVDNTVLVDGEGSAIIANTLPDSIGDGGNITVDPVLVQLSNGAQISVASEGTGIAGNILMLGDTLLLDNGQINADTLSTDGGNITLLFNEIITLENGSRISTSAGTAQAGGDGGNIVIAVPYIVGAPDENNDITANAFEGRGGRVEITADGIFYLIPRSRAELEALLRTTDPAQLDPINLPTNDITAISQVDPDLQGEVVLTSPDADPNQGTIALPDNIIDASRLIAQGCSGDSVAASEIGSLIVTGRGGLPTDPSEALNYSQLLLNWATVETPPTAESNDNPVTAAPDSEIAPTPEVLQEVQALAVNEAGDVVLLAQGPGQLSDTGLGFPVLTCADD